MSLKIESAFPGGNVFIEDINGFEVLLTRDMRNTAGDWFYWCFKALFDEEGLYRFTFTQPDSCSSCGPAVSYDNGLTWEWLSLDCVSGQHNVFTYRFDGTKNPEVIFCVGMQYLPRHLEEFLQRHAGNPCLTQSVLTRSRKNRSVPLLHIEDTSCTGTKKRLYFSSRNHCCEMMATYALEGILETALGEDETGKLFRQHYVIDCVPFADMDGVVDGDQGKNRRPHDHNRDYGNAPIYPEVRAIQELLQQAPLFFALDLHCPWLYGTANNETIYFPGPEEEYYAKEMEKFSRILERRSPEEAPHFTANNIPFGTKWNTRSNYSTGSGLNCSGWIRKVCQPHFAQAMEIPYAKAGEKVLNTTSVRAFGRAIAQSILEYDRVITSGNALH